LPSRSRQDDASNTGVCQRVWHLYATGRTHEILAYMDPAVEWRPSVLDATVYRGHAGVREWAETARSAWKSITVVYDDMREVTEDCVVSDGRISAFDHGGERVIDSPLACVAEFRDGLVVRACTFVSLDEAMAWVSSRPGLP
jgi:hypothetical protein